MSKKKIDNSGLLEYNNRLSSSCIVEHDRYIRFVWINFQRSGTYRFLEIREFQLVIFGTNVPVCFDASESD